MEAILELYKSLKEESENIRKLGKRRHEDLGQRKLLKVNELYNNYKLIVRNITSTSSAKPYLDACEQIESLYYKILSYYSQEREEREITMNSFDLKTASTIIPIMDGKEETNERIIEGIEMLNEYSKGEENKKLLISFVLKTRLSKAAKLKLQSEYTTVDSLLTDIKLFLLTRKSANSLLSQLNNLAQNNLTISKYGEKLEDLFIGLTIAQAEGNPKVTAILRPINERLALKRFADGLRNRRLSTIIAARNFTTLKDAVRAAEDEELSTPGPSGQGTVYMYSRNVSRGRYPRYNRGRNFYRGNQRGQYQYQGHQGHNQHQGQGNYRYQNTPVRYFNNNRGRYQRAYARSSRGNYRGNSYNNHDNRQRNCYFTERNDESDQKEEETVNLAEFFRA